MTVRIMRRYFGHDFRVCEFYHDHHGDCCDCFPCINSSINLTKNHDFELTDPNHPGIPKVKSVPYLVMVRNYLEASVSGYHLFLRRNPDTRKSWKRYVEISLPHYQRFIQKWVRSNDSIEKLVIRYEDLTADPYRVLGEIASFFQPGEQLDTARLGQLIDSVESEDSDAKRTKLVKGSGVQATRKIEDFRHFTPRFFRNLEKELTDEFSALGYDRRYAA